MSKEDLFSRFTTRLDENRHAQSQKLARGLTIQYRNKVVCLRGFTSPLHYLGHFAEITSNYVQRLPEMKWHLKPKQTQRFYMQGLYYSHNFTPFKPFTITHVWSVQFCLEAPCNQILFIQAPVGRILLKQGKFYKVCCVQQRSCSYYSLICNFCLHMA